MWFQNAVSRGRCRNLIGASKWKFESEFSTSRTKSQKSNRTSGHPKVKILNGPLDTSKNYNRTFGHQKLKSATQHPDNEKFKFDTDLWTPPSSALKKNSAKSMGIRGCFERNQQQVAQRSSLSNKNYQNSLEIFRNPDRVHGAGVLQYVLLIFLAAPPGEAKFSWRDESASWKNNASFSWVLKWFQELWATAPQTYHRFRNRNGTGDVL